MVNGETGAAAGDATKKQQPMTSKTKRRNASKAVRRRSSSPTGRKADVARLSRELSEAFEQQAATAEILSIISNSPTDTQPVFDSIVQSGLKLFPGALISVALRDGDMIIAAAIADPDPDRVEAWRRTIFRTPLTREYMHSAALLDCRIVDISDVEGAPAEFAAGARNFLTSGYRAITIMPMVRNNEAIGLLSVVRLTPGPLSDKQIAVLRTFATQAVIAIENTRLFNEMRESLEQQTATSEVLRIVSSSPGALEPVFQAMLENTTRVCEAHFGLLWQIEAGAARVVASLGVPQAFSEFMKGGPYTPSENAPMTRVIRTKKALHIHDFRTEQAYHEGDPLVVAGVELAEVRTLLVVPMVKDKELVGIIAIFRQEVRPFSDKQVDLVKNFANQAVIAIENTRLLNELRQRTQDLTESLEQQTATSEVLKVISSSPGDLAPVFDAMLENACRICAAKFGTLFRYDGELFHPVARSGAPAALVEFQKELGPFRPPESSNLLGHLLREKTISQVDDEQLSSAPSPPAKYGGARSAVAVPMLKDNELAGAFVIYRQEVRPFTKKQVELLTNFAAQAVIAIENTRLLNELRESLQQQTATADVLKVISRSTFELQPVFDSMAESAVKLCEAERAYIFRFDGQVLRAVASFNAGPESKDWVYRNPIPLGRSSVSARAGLEQRTVQVADIQADPEYSYVARDVDPIRTTLAVPMLKGDELIGTITIYRLEVRPFTENQIALMETFADQAVIAIENARLFESLQTRTRELAKSLEDLRTTQDRLVQTEKLASLGQLTAGIAHEIKNPLNFVNNFSGVSTELIDELQEVLSDVHLNGKKRGEITELVDTLRGNLGKVVQHGKRADAIVKNMLLHSRAGSGEHRPVDINALVEESLNLAYHGARAEKQGFNITMEKSFDPTAGEVDLFPQEITRVLLNLISNGFYAATKRKAEGNGGDGYEPTLAAATRNLGDNVEITIRDNGTGIPPEVKDKMFNPFFTTKPTGEGTGLGLSISHDVIVKQHGGSIDVDTQPGAFTEFRIVLPRGAATIAKSGEHN